LRRGLQKSRNCAQGYYNLGIAQKNLGQLSLAVTAYREAIRLDSRMADAHLNLANLYVEMGNYSQALSHYRGALEINPAFRKAEAGIAATQARMEEARHSSSPFGRLVDTRSAGGEVAQAPRRPLTDAERRHDRHTLQRLADEIETLAGQCRDQLKYGLEPSLLALTRTVVSDAHKIAVQQVHETFQQALREAAETRRELKARLQQLRQHEEQIRGITGQS
jgi:tetratricopeptide (TPR) repeat protein